MGKSHKRDRDEEDPEARALRKEAKKAEKMAKVLGYSNDVNPFGDSNLLQPFVWGKKKEKDQYEKKDMSSGSTRNRTEMIGEIEKVRKRRAERENEMAEIERLRDEEQRLREVAQYDDWQRKEETFILEQTRQRSKIRLMDNREQPIDMVAKNILLVEAARKAKETNKADAKELNILELEGELRNPITILQTLNIEQLRKLVKDAEDYLNLEISREGSYQNFWRSFLTVVSIEAQKMASDAPSSVHDAISRDVEDLLKGKSVRELDDLERDIEKSLREGRGGDVEYWELMKSEVKVQRAKAEVQATHVQLLKEQLSLLAEIRETASISVRPAQTSKAATGGAGEDMEKDRDMIPIDMGDREDKMEIQDEVAISSSGTYWWQDKYRPRKPRYFNRVRSGWDRTKYNLSHYDHDNPPPKMIQGYKFTLFYPDLIDKEKTPKYILEPCDEANGGKDFVIIRFHAGPPYEDVAFKIINKEWDIHRKSGFLSMFDRGVLQLNFNFKRTFYRR
mmetsp:Transcript_111745/g.219060  ORF Transcript_111745/g.219060 Transcript_111745/m.219060 type:complete len:507 (-) Transcript_111745:200-1720(-)